MIASSTVRAPNQPVAFLSASHQLIPSELQSVAGQAVADLAGRLHLKRARLGPDCFCRFLRRPEECGPYRCDLRDLSGRFLDHSILLTSATGEKFLMGSNYTDDSDRNWHLGRGAREPVGEDAERLQREGLSWEVLETSPYFPEHTTSVIFRRDKDFRRAHPRESVRSRMTRLLGDGFLRERMAAGQVAHARAKEQSALAERLVAEAKATGDLDLLGQATAALIEGTQALIQAQTADLTMLDVAIDLKLDELQEVLTGKAP